MYQEPMFLQPVFKTRIWGGDKLSSLYGYPIPNDHTGEAWVISAHKNGPSVIENGPLAGKTLYEAWKEHPSLFNRPQGHSEAYPLLVKMIDANDDLSVQVHPNDDSARHIENEAYGKTECWYVLEAEPDAEIVLGHHATTRETLVEQMDNGEWDKLLSHTPVQAGDFFYVPSGTIHAIGKGIVILEIQQSSDITYRVYDYDRNDSNGQKRDLHLEKAKQVTMVPHQTIEPEQPVTTTGDLEAQQLVEAPYFSVFRWHLDGEVTQPLDADFLQVSVIEGKAELKAKGRSFQIDTGSHFILPYGLGDYVLEGQATFIVSYPAA